MTHEHRTIGLVYYRTSTHKQFKMISPELQRQECLLLAQRDGCKVDEKRDFYWDNESAFLVKGGKRQGFQRLTERWKTDQRVRAVYIYDLSRLFRDARGYFNYKYDLDAQGVELVSVVEPLLRDNSPAGRLPAGIIALVNQYNSEIYGNKIRDAMKFKAEAGIYPGKAPFAYRNVREEGEGKRRAWIEVNDDEAPWLKKAFLLYSQGIYGLRQLADQLAEEGFPTRNSRPLQPSVLEAILKDRIYIGWVEWGAVLNPEGKHEKLIDVETFDRAQAVFAAHNHGANRQRKHTFLLRGFAWCGECGSRIQAGYSRGRSGRRYGLYFCQRRQSGHPVSCAQRSIPLDTLEKQLARLFEWCELSPGGVRAVERRIEEKLGSKQRTYEDTRRAMERSLADVRAAKKKAFLKFATDDVDAHTYQEAMQTLEQDEIKLLRRLERVKGDLSTAIRAVRIAKELARDISSDYAKASDAVRSLLAQAFFERISVAGGGIKEAVLTAPAEFVCFEKVKESRVFKLGVSGGDARSLLEPITRLWEPGSARVVGLLEKAYEAVRRDPGLKAA